MLFQRAFLDGLANGSITLAFRRWRRPTVKAGGTLTTRAGVLAIDAVEQVDEGAISEADARRAGYPDRSALMAALNSRPDGRVYRIELHRAGPDPRIALRAADALGKDAIADLAARLARLDKASRHGAWTRETLTLIAHHPARRAVDLADMVGRAKPDFKRDVRKLKALGLTESLDIGYRLSPRGKAYLKASALTE